MKQKYYSGKKIKDTNSDYNVILGERSNGKSFWVKHDCLSDAIKDSSGKNNFIYLRRWDLEIRPNMVELYFADCNIELITNGESDSVICHNQKIYLSKTDDKNKKIKQRVIGYTRALSMESHYTSGSYLDVNNIIYEEFISRSSYLPHEPKLLQQFVSTVARRRKIKVWLIGNTISRVCPYFNEWELRNIPKQKQGTIDIYEHKTDQIDDSGSPINIKIAVEFAENSGNNSKMFFGTSSKMITSGIWQSEDKPHLPKKLNDENYSIMHRVVVECMGFKFLCKFLMDTQTGAPIWYVEPKTTETKPKTRLITDRLVIDPHATRSFSPLSKEESIAFNYLKQGIVCYSDNLTGTDFESCYKQILTRS